MSVFFLAEFERIKDETVYRDYTEKAAPIIKKYGGEYVFRSNQIKRISGDWDPQRVILIRFNDQDQVRRCFQSIEYKEIAPLREESTISKAIIEDTLLTI